MCQGSVQLCESIKLLIILKSHLYSDLNSILQTSLTKDLTYTAVGETEMVVTVL